MHKKVKKKSATFSSYNTAMGLIGIAPSDAITFVSDLYAGRFSDRKITAHSGIYNLLEEGDSIMADRGFELDAELPKGVTLNIPPFLDGRKQLNLTNKIQTRHIASVRVHVERAIETYTRPMFLLQKKILKAITFEILPHLLLQSLMT